MTRFESGVPARAQLLGLALVFAELAGCHAQWKQALEGRIVQQSLQVLEWQAEAEKRGEDRGKAAGKAEGKAEALLEALEFRFPPGAPAELAALIRSTTDLAKLKRWSAVALKAASLDEFRADL